MLCRLMRRQASERQNRNRMKFFSSIKTWGPVRIGMLAGLGLGVGDIGYRILTNPNAPPSFYTRPYVWLAQSLILLITSSEQRLAHDSTLFIAELLGYFIYFAVLGALFGFVFKLLVLVSRKLKHHDAPAR